MNGTFFQRCWVPHFLLVACKGAMQGTREPRGQDPTCRPGPNTCPHSEAAPLHPRHSLSSQLWALSLVFQRQPRGHKKSGPGTASLLRAPEQVKSLRLSEPQFSHLSNGDENHKENNELKITEKVAGTLGVPDENEIEGLKVICAEWMTHRGFSDENPPRQLHTVLLSGALRYICI